MKKNKNYICKDSFKKMKTSTYLVIVCVHVCNIHVACLKLSSWFTGKYLPEEKESHVITTTSTSKKSRRSLSLL